MLPHIGKTFLSVIVAPSTFVWKRVRVPVFGYQHLSAGIRVPELDYPGSSAFRSAAVMARVWAPTLVADSTPAALAARALLDSG